MKTVIKLEFTSTANDDGAFFSYYGTFTLRTLVYLRRNTQNSLITIIVIDNVVAV